jgi:hypothetical protein
MGFNLFESDDKFVCMAQLCGRYNALSDQVSFSRLLQVAFQVIVPGNGSSIQTTRVSMVLTSLKFGKPRLTLDDKKI